jgi:hypothetical protein
MIIDLRLKCWIVKQNRKIRKQSSFFHKPSDPIPDLMLTLYKEWGCGIPKLNDFGLKALYCGPQVKTSLGH